MFVTKGFLKISMLASLVGVLGIVVVIGVFVFAGAHA
jgi:hypothetical protein